MGASADRLCLGGVQVHGRVGMGRRAVSLTLSRRAMSGQLATEAGVTPAGRRGVPARQVRADAVTACRAARSTSEMPSLIDALPSDSTATR